MFPLICQNMRRLIIKKSPADYLHKVYMFPASSASQLPPSGDLVPDAGLADGDGEADKPREAALWFLPRQSRLQVCRELRLDA